jgi:hypothetical protein
MAFAGGPFSPCNDPGFNAMGKESRGSEADTETTTSDTSPALTVTNASPASPVASASASATVSGVAVLSPAALLGSANAETGLTEDIGDDDL